MRVTFGSIISYVVGVPLAVFGLLFTVESPVAGVVMLITGLFLTPIARRKISSSADVEFSRGAVVGIAIVGILTSGILLAMAAPASQPGDDVSNVTVQHQDIVADNPNYELSVTYNTRAQESVDPNPDSMTHYDSDDGEKYLVVRAIVENQGESDVELRSRLFQFESEGVVHERQALFGSDGFGQVTLQPEAEVDGWVAFSIPEDATEGTLTANEEVFFQEELTVEFEHDDTIAINMAE